MDRAGGRMLLSHPDRAPPDRVPGIMSHGLSLCRSTSLTASFIINSVPIRGKTRDGKKMVAYFRAGAQERTDDVKHALIIAASRGLGLGLVHEYLARGWHVTATTRTPSAE